MPVDASIPLQVQRPRLMTPADALSLQNLVQTNQMEAMQLAKARKSEQERDLILRVMSTPDAYDEDGVVSLNTIRRLGAISPELSFKASNEREHVMRERSAAQSRALQDSSNAQVLTSRFTEQINKLNEDARVAVQDLVAAGAPPATINKAYEQKRRELFEGAMRSGAFAYLPQQPIPGTQLPTQDQVQNVLSYPMTYEEATARAPRPSPEAQVTLAQRQEESKVRQQESAERMAEQRRANMAREEEARLRREEKRDTLVEKKEAAQADARARVDAVTSDLGRLEEAATRLLNHKGLPGITGLKGMLPRIPGSDRADAEAQLNALKSRVFVNVLAAMREASKTGGAVGQVTEREGDKIEATLGSLERAQSYEQLQQALRDIIEYAKEGKGRVKSAYEEKYGAPTQPAGDMSGKPVPRGTPAEQTKPKGTEPKASGLPKVKSIDEARKLPKGTRFIDPNGVERIR